MGEKKEALQTEWEEVRYLGQVRILWLTSEFIVISSSISTKYLRQYWHQYQLQYQYSTASVPVLPVIAWLASQDEDMDVKERMEELTLDQEDASERVAKAR